MTPTLSNNVERKRILLPDIVGILGALLGVAADLGSAYVPSGCISVWGRIWSIITAILLPGGS